MKNIRELLQTRPLLFDGAMGTYYKAAPGVAALFFLPSISMFPKM